MKSLRPLEMQKRCPESFIWTILPHLPVEIQSLLAYSQKACAQFGKNDTLRSVAWHLLMTPSKTTTKPAATVKPTCR